MLDKNHDQNLNNNFQSIANEFSNKNPNMVLCSEPFTKSNFLHLLINSIDIPIFFLDFDLLYSGYLESSMVPKKKKVIVYQLEKNNLCEKISEIAEKISKEKCLIILDSFNGLHSFFTELKSSMFLNSILMLLSSIANQTNSIIIVSIMARKSDGDWVLTPGGRQIIESEKLGKYQLTNEKNSFILKSLNKNSVFKLEF